MAKTKNIRVDLEANQSLSVEIPLEESPPGEPLFAKLWLWVRESGKLGKMSGSACKVYLAILTRSNFTTLESWPSSATLRADTQLGSQAVFSGLADLIRLGLITKVSGLKSGPDQRNIPNRYQIVRPPAGWNSPSMEIKQGLGENQTRACSETKQGLYDKEPEPCSIIKHKLEKENNRKLTTAAEVSFEPDGGEEEPAVRPGSPQAVGRLVDLFYRGRPQRLSKPRPAVAAWLTERLAKWNEKTIRYAIETADWADDPAGVDRVLDNLPTRSRTRCGRRIAQRAKRK